MKRFLKELCEGLDRKGWVFSFFCLVMTFITSVCTVLQPFFLTKIIDAFENNGYFWQFFLMAAVAYIIGRLVSEARWFVIGYPEERMVLHMKMKYLRRVLLKSPDFLRKHPMGEILAKLSTIQSAIFSISRNMFFSFIPLFMNLFVLLLIVYIYFSYIYFTILLLSLSFYIFVMIKGSDYMDQKVKDCMKAYNKSFSVLSDVLSNRTLLRNYNYEKQEEDKYEKTLHRNFSETMRSIFRRGVFGVIQASVVLLSILSILALSAYDLKNGNISMGNFILINTYILQLLSPLESLSMLYRGIKESFIGVDLLNKTVDDFGYMKFGEKDIDASDGIDIEFKNVSFKYPGSENLVLDNLNFKIKAKSFVGIVGKSGSGKSTITALLSRLHEPTAGEILFNNIPIQELSREALHKCFTNISQVTQIISDTICNNLLMGKKGSEEAIKNMCKSLNIDKQINLLKDGYDTEITLHDKKLSEGQLQRISVARGILAEKPLLILDEVTSSVDHINEKDLLRALDSLINKKSIIFITHKLKSLQKADNILVFDNGNLVEIGDHSTLMAKNSYYYDLVQGIKLGVDKI
ncbi:MAG: ABC-type multidrug transport system fused ATPase/permease subunit [Candidatus Midichloriaceae bacterium]|jgi:ABC-type multidrug transport system fused ATPase/permease subunit